MSEKKNSLRFTNIHVFYVLKDKTSKKKISVCLSVRPSVCLYERGLFMRTQWVGPKTLNDEKSEWPKSRNFNLSKF